MLAGALDARCNGRPMQLRADGDLITASIAVRHAWALRRFLHTHAPLRQLLARIGLRVSVRMWGVCIPVLPGHPRSRER